jgi:hypothetical protein
MVFRLKLEVFGVVRFFELFDLRILSLIGFRLGLVLIMELINIFKLQELRGEPFYLISLTQASVFFLHYPRLFCRTKTEQDMI